MNNDIGTNVDARLEEQKGPKDLTPKRRSPVRKVVATLPVMEQEAVPVMTEEEKRNTVEWQRQRDKEVVRIRFVNNEQRGAPLEFPYKAYKGDRVERYYFEDGGIYDVPFGVAMHINYNCSTPMYEHIDKKTIAGHNPDQRGAFRVTSLQNRFSAIPLNFRESDFLGPNCNRVLKVESLNVLGYQNR